MPELENITYDELHVDDYATFTKTLTEEALILYAANSDKVIANDFSFEAAHKAVYKENIGYGMWVNDLISNGFSRVIPGLGSIYLEQELKFEGKVELLDTLSVKLSVTEKQAHNRTLFFCEVFNQDAELIVSGDAKVIAPSEKVTLESDYIPRIKLIKP